MSLRDKPWGESMVFMHLANGKATEVAKAVRVLPKVTRVVTVAGKYTAFAQLHPSTFGELCDVVDQIQGVPGVLHVDVVTFSPEVDGYITKDENVDAKSLAATVLIHPGIKRREIVHNSLERIPEVVRYAPIVGIYGFQAEVQAVDPAHMGVVLVDKLHMIEGVERITMLLHMQEY